MIVITGASSGIGEAAARRLAHEGHELFLIARRKDRLRSLKRELERSGATVHLSQVDISQKQDVAAWAKKNAPTLKRCCVLINNAGLALGLNPIQDAPLNDLEQMISTNLMGLIYVTKALLPSLIKNQGHIINLGSVAGRWVYPKGHVYCASKSAVRSFNEGLRLDLNGTGVRVSEIAPGMVETEFSQVRLKSARKAKQVYQGMMPLTAEDIADSIAWTLNRPKHINIQEMVIYPTDQASPTVVHRRQP